MKFSLILIMSFGLFVISSCNNNVHTKNPKLQVPEIYTDLFNNDVYKKAIQIDTSNCLYFKEKRGLIYVFKSAKATIQITGSEIYLKINEYVKLSVCNLPQELYKKNIGDTVIISGYGYNVFGNESSIGDPSILYEIRLRN